MPGTQRHPVPSVRSRTRPDPSDTFRPDVEGTACGRGAAGRRQPRAGACRPAATSASTSSSSSPASSSPGCCCASTPGAGRISLRDFYARRVRRLLPGGRARAGRHQRGGLPAVHRGAGGAGAARLPVVAGLPRQRPLLPLGTDYFDDTRPPVAGAALLVAGRRGAVLRRLAVPAARRAVAGPRAGRVAALVLVTAASFAWSVVGHVAERDLGLLLHARARLGARRRRARRRARADPPARPDPRRCSAPRWAGWGLYGDPARRAGPRRAHALPGAARRCCRCWPPPPCCSAGGRARRIKNPVLGTGEPLLGTPVVLALPRGTGRCWAVDGRAARAAARGRPAVAVVRAGGAVPPPGRGAGPGVGVVGRRNCPRLQPREPPAHRRGRGRGRALVGGGFVLRPWRCRGAAAAGPAAPALAPSQPTCRC
jgi:hypothetical protein